MLTPIHKINSLYSEHIELTHFFKINPIPICTFCLRNYKCMARFTNHLLPKIIPKKKKEGETLTLNRPGGGISPQAGSSLCCAETVSNRKPKLSDFYYILIGFNSDHKSSSWDIHCYHGNAIVEECLV